jgi:hypothetical protein
MYQDPLRRNTRASLKGPGISEAEQNTLKGAAVFEHFGTSSAHPLLQRERERERTREKKGWTLSISRE